MPPVTEQAEILTQLRETGGFSRRDDLGLLLISGADATQFLQSQTTQDIQGLSEGQTRLNAAVDRQGKIQGLFLHTIQADAHWLILEKAQIEPLTAHFKKFVILQQVQFEDVTDQYDFFQVWGLSASSDDPSSVYVDNSPRWPDTQLSISSKGKSPKNLRDVELNAEAFEALRVESGVLGYGRDFTNETLLPETGLQLACVSYDKGCYLGQEVIARVKTYGSLQRAMAGLIFKANLSQSDVTKLLLGVSLPTEILADGKPIGHLTSLVSSPTLLAVIGLAYLDKSHRTPGQTLSLTIGGHALEAKVSLLPFVASVPPAASNGSDPALAQTLFDEGLQHFAQGDDEKAIEKLEAAIAAQLDFAEAYEALGVILGRHERIEEAIALMHRLLEVDPDHVLAHTNLSIFYLKLGDKDKAEEEKAKATVAGMRQYAKKAGVDFAKLEAERKQREEAKRQQLEERIELFKQALVYSPDDPLGNFGLGSACLELMRYAEAIEPLEKTIQAQPKHTVAYLSLGKAYEGSGRKSEAKGVYEKGIEVAAARGDRMPLEEMQGRLAKLG